MARTAQDESERPTAEVARVAATAGLGAHTGTWRRGHHWWWPTFGLVVGGAVLTFSVWSFVANGGGAWWWVAGLAVLLAPFAVVVAASVRALVDPRLWRTDVFGFAGGLVRRDGRGALEVLRWDGIAHVTRRRVRARGNDPAYHYTVEPRTGRAWSMSSHEFRGSGRRSVGEHVERELLARRLPDAEARIARGERLAFGEVVLDATGISGPADAVPWSAVKGVRTGRAVEVRTAGERRHLSRIARSRPDEFLLEALARRLARG